MEFCTCESVKTGPLHFFPTCIQLCVYKLMLCIKHEYSGTCTH